MKYFLTSGIYLFLTLSASLTAEEHHYFEDFPKYASKNISEFCEQGIRISDYNLYIQSTEYINGYWQGQKDAYIYMKDIIDN